MLTVFIAATGLSLNAQALTINNNIQTMPTLTESTTLIGTAELHITGNAQALGTHLVELNSPDAWFFMDNVLPSQVAANVLAQVRVNGANAVLNKNVRVVQYAQGAVVIPHSPNFAPLTVYTEPNFTGNSRALNQYTAYTSANLGEFSNAISAFTLKRGYMATFAANDVGTGASQVFIAQDGDLTIGALPAELNNKIKFIRVFPWRWSTKKGIAGNAGPNLKTQWDYNWNISKNSSLDQEYVAIRQTRWWPDLEQNWQTRGINHLLGYNEPNSADQADILVGDAVWSWPDVLATGLRTGSPAPTDGGLSWLNNFMTQANAEKKRVDFIAVHYYRCFGNAADATGAANQFYNFLKGIYDTHKKPIWITEWNNGANWTTCADPTATQQQATIAAMLKMLDETPFVERYAIYNWVEDSRRVSWDDGSLTAAGNTYRDHISPIAYSQQIPDAGTPATATFNFENNTRDTGANFHHAMQVGAQEFSDGIDGKALVFDGQNDYLQLSSAFGRLTDMTFSAWVYWEGGAIWQRIFDFGNDANQYVFLTPSSYSKTLRFGIKNNSAEQTLDAGVELPINSWAHVAVTLAGDTGKIYLNGQLMATNTALTLNPSSFNGLRNFIGKSQFSADPLFKGKIDQITIYNNALNDSQIAELSALQTTVNSSSAVNSSQMNTSSANANASSTAAISSSSAIMASSSISAAEVSSTSAAASSSSEAAIIKLGGALPWSYTGLLLGALFVRCRRTIKAAHRPKN
jgi:hypothetical protein